MKISAAPKKLATLEQVMKAAGDPLRISVIRQLLAAKSAEKACGTFDYAVSKATFSHHLDILEAAGLIQRRRNGTRKMVSLNREALEKKFPGLIELILHSK